MQDTNLYIAKSNIHGVGVFSKKYLYPNEIVMIAISPPKKISYFGSKINHSYSPNCYLDKHHDTYYLRTKDIILPHTELTANYNDTPYFIKKPETHYI